jgi:hypothetical protein
MRGGRPMPSSGCVFTPPGWRPCRHRLIGARGQDRCGRRWRVKCFIRSWYGWRRKVVMLSNRRPQCLLILGCTWPNVITHFISIRWTNVNIHTGIISTLLTHVIIHFR